MKIVLIAFGGRLSGVMEVPEKTGSRFKLAMTQQIQFMTGIIGRDKERPMMSSPIDTICEFEWTGGTFMQDGHDYNGAREYQLVDISKQ